MIPACSDDTIQKLRDLHPERSLDLNLDNLTTPESLTAFWDSEDGLALKEQMVQHQTSSKIFPQLQSPWRRRY
jgi:hypothetical protein